MNLYIYNIFILIPIYPNINATQTAIECINNVEKFFEKTGIFAKITYPTVQFPYHVPKQNFGASSCNNWRIHIKPNREKIIGEPPTLILSG
jgi:hypothetical protein